MMKTIKLNNKGVVVLLLLVIFFSSCSKTEFLPDPEGKEIPYEMGTTQTVEQLLAASPAKLYYKAWQKSNFSNQVREKGNKFLFTVFVPSDAAMIASGLNEAAIEQMQVADLDTLMMFYTTVGQITEQEITARNDNFIVKTMLDQPGLRVKFYDSNLDNQQGYDLYYFRHYVGVKSDQLLVDGKPVGKLNYAPAINGGIYFMEKTIQKTLKTALETLKEDGRFTIFLESQRLLDELYLDKIGSDLEPLFGYIPDHEEIKVNYAYNRLYMENGWGLDRPIYEGYIGPNVQVSTFFAPTDAAFKAAGFESLADVIRFNKERMDVRFDDNTFSAVGGFPMDTIFSFHRDWGRIKAPQDPAYGKPANNATVFYSNVLNATLNNYLVNAGGNPPIEYAYFMPLEFATAGNAIRVKVKESEFPAATIVDTDIKSLNGPIHVVDHLLIPKGFKLK